MSSLQSLVLGLCVLPIFTIASSAAVYGCECGYTVNATDAPSFSLFTDLLETDFLHLSSLSGSGWVPQTYNVSPSDARGPYGKMATDANVVPNPLKNRWDWAGESVDGSGAGLELWVRSKPIAYTAGGGGEELLGMGEIVASRGDMLYGSFRVGVKMTGTPGTCGAFFWFRNDTQEIDMEFLSKQFSQSNNSVNLVLQSPQSASAGFDASRTGSFVVFPLPFEPNTEFHEYRFDWFSDRVSFFADGIWLRDMVIDLPNAPGRLMLNHWSNGDPSWSAGPPADDAVMTISYVKAYFNSSDPTRVSAWKSQCGGDAAGVLNRTCEIPTQTVPPDPSGSDGNSTARTYFFTIDGGASQDTNATNQESGHHSAAAGLRSAMLHAAWGWLLTLLLAAALMW